MAKTKATGPLPTQILNPPETKEPSPREPEQAEPPVDEQDGEGDPLDRRAPPIGPSRGSVQAYRPIPLPTFNPIEQGAAGQEPQQPQGPRFPGLFGRGLGAPPPPAAPPAPAVTSVNEPPPGSLGYVSDEKMMRNLLSGMPDELLVNIKVWRVVEGQPAEEIGTLDFVPASIARDPTNFIDVKGMWIIDYRRSSDGKPVSKSKRISTGGPDYYPGWKPHLIGGDMDQQQFIGNLGKLFKEMGWTPPTALVQPGQPGTIGVPTDSHNKEIHRLESQINKLEAERTALLGKIEDRDREIRALDKKNTILEMKVATLESRPAQKEGESDLVTIAKVFAATNKKEESGDMWKTILQMQQDHSRQMVDIISKRGGDAQMDRINSAWTTLFDGAKKMAEVNKAGEGADLAKALAPIGVQWLAGQQQMQMEAMRLKAAQQGVKVPAAATPQATQQPTEQPTEPAKPELTEEQQRIKMKSDLFEVTMGMIIDRVSKGAPAKAIGDELATAVRTVLGQELAEGHPEHQMMIRVLLENPESSLKELAKNAGKDEAYAIAVSNRFKETFRRLAAEEQTEEPKPAASTETPSPAPPDPHPVAAQDGAADTSGPSAPPAPGPEAAAPSAESDPSSGNGKGQGGEPGPVAEGSGGHDHRDGDGVGEAGEGVQGTRDPAVSN